MDNTLVVKNLDGVDITINVVDIIEDTMTGKEFICYSIEGLEGNFISSLIQDETSYSLGAVTLEEKANIENLMSNRFGE